MKRIVFFYFFLAFIAVSMAVDDVESTDQTFNKRDVLDKRTDKRKCPCTLARSVFDGKLSEGPVRGLVVYGQDENGYTTITGLFTSGFENTNKTYTVTIVDGCGNLLYDITCELDLKFTGNGGSKPFAHKFKYINLDCYDNGILFTKTSKKLPLNEGYYGYNDCKKLYKRVEPYAYMRINSDGDGYSEARIEGI